MPILGVGAVQELTCNTSDASVFVPWIAFARQLASEIFIPNSMRSYFMPIDFTPYVRSSFRGVYPPVPPPTAPVRYP